MGRPWRLGIAFALGGALPAAGAPAPERWEEVLRRAAFEKRGLQALHAPHYQYGILGLGGTTLRAGPYGFTRPGAPRIHPGGHLRHLPYLAYQYWWDEEGHRHLPFDVTGGYGDAMEPGQITSFRQTLDIRTGLLTIDLGLRADLAWEGLYQIGRNAFHSRREMFVTPDGVLVVRITDSPEAALPFRVRVDANRQVRVYLNQGIYQGEQEPWSGSAAGRPGGMVAVVTRPRSCRAALAAALDAPAPFIDAESALVGSLEPGHVLTLYLAPGSSYESEDVAGAAWAKADRARSRGYEALRRETAEWWADFWGRSWIDLPDPTLAAWYARSLYYHGVFFGNTDIPPGCNGTSIESFAGAVCPEYDLVFSQLALLYTGHFAETGRVADWLARVLPRAQRYAVEGLTLHEVTVQYPAGAKYGTLMGHDGTVTVPPTAGEGVHAHANYPGANAALMALAHADWAADGRHDEIARRILRETARVAAADLEWRPDFEGYLDRRLPHSVQQSAALFGLREAVRRGVAGPGWEEMAGKIILPTGPFQGTDVIVAGPGAAPFPGYGDACWMSGVWWYGNLTVDDPRAAPTYAMIRASLTGNYVFNNGWMGVLAAKLGEGEEACAWAKRMLQPGVTLFDDTCFGEIVYDAEDFKKTPEIAAHAALLCNVTQMLLDPDDGETLSVFPAIPEAWEREGVAFAGLAARGGIAVSGACANDRVRVALRNRSSNSLIRRLRVRLPGGAGQPARAPQGTRLEDGWAILDAVRLAPGAEIAFSFGG